jgi:hypothetical protein
MIGHGWSVDRNALHDRLLGGVPLANAYIGNYIELTWLDINFKTPQQMRRRTSWLCMIRHHITYV